MIDFPENYLAVEGSFEAVSGTSVGFSADDDKAHTHRQKSDREGTEAAPDISNENQATARFGPR